MQKTKKITWQAIAIAVLSLLLVLALALGISGAWFQDNATGTADVTLGGAVTFVLEENDTEFVERTVPGVLPGGEIFEAVKLTADANTSDMLFRVKVVVNFTNGDLEPTDPNYFDGTTYEEKVMTDMGVGVDTDNWTLSGDYYYYTAGTANAVAVEAGNTVAFTTDALVCPTTWGNEVLNQPFTITITAEAVQAANGAAADLGWAILPLAA